MTHADESSKKGWPTAEQAIDAFNQTRSAGDVPAFLRTINFRPAALAALTSEGKSPTDEQVSSRADEMETRLRLHLEAHGFFERDCKVVTAFHDSDVEVRFIVGCTSATGAGAEPVRVRKFEGGWLVVRGGPNSQSKGPDRVGWRQMIDQQANE
jgi:hypothetical protein